MKDLITEIQELDPLFTLERHLQYLRIKNSPIQQFHKLTLETTWWLQEQEEFMRFTAECYNEGSFLNLKSFFESYGAKNLSEDDYLCFQFDGSIFRGSIAQDLLYWRKYKGFETYKHKKKIMITNEMIDGIYVEAE